MYRLFCNNKTLVCRNFFEQSLDADINDSVRSTQMFENAFNRVKKWLEESNENLEIDDVDNDVFAAVIKEIFKFAPAAGGLVIVNNAIAAIERNGIPDLPKGHIEKNESPEVAALREVYEETALSNLSIIKQLPSTFHCYLLNNQWTLKKTSWFLMKSDDDFKPKPQVEEGISNVYLLNKDNVNDFLEKTYSSIRLSLENEILDVVMAKGQR
ncbi:MAG: NUDIX domain-containing protein [Bacteroidales bacterium]|nr:NUDIX domain-containing protein [Bacteroidales bacterium]